MMGKAKQVEVPAVAEKLAAVRAYVDFPTIGVSKGDVLAFGDRPIEAGRLLLVKDEGGELLAQVYHSRRRKALRLRLVGLRRFLDLDAVEVLGTAVGLNMRRYSGAWTGEVSRKVRAWRPKWVQFGDAA